MVQATTETLYRSLAVKLDACLPIDLKRRSTYLKCLLLKVSGAMADDGKPQVHKSCRALALSLVKCLDQSACMQEEKRSYKDCALDKNLTASPACRDIRDNYMKCKHEQVGIVVRERLFNNPELLRVV